MSENDWGDRVRAFLVAERRRTAIYLNDLSDLLELPRYRPMPPPLSPDQQEVDDQTLRQPRD